MELEIETLAFGGRGVARFGSEVWFVAGALPGERVRVQEERRRRGIVEARAVQVVSPSPWREPEPCPKALATCGGCNLAHVATAFRERAYKASLGGALRGAPPALVEAVIGARFHPSPWHYRLRGRLHWAPDRHALGFFAPHSHRVETLEGCRVLSRQLVELLPSWAEALKAARVPPGEVEFLEDLASNKRLVRFRGVFSGKLPSLPGTAGFWGVDGRGWGEKELTLELPRPLSVPVGAFVQGNRFLLPELWRMVEVLVREGRFAQVVDLYGGVGFFAAAAQQGGAEEVTVVEVSRRAAAAAQKNLPGARVVAITAEEAVAKNVLAGGSLAILDPPRGGLSPGVRHGVAASGVQAVLYVSCDPACLARDARVLVESGFSVTKAELFDLFAGSHHVELAVLFQRA